MLWIVILIIGVLKTGLYMQNFSEWEGLRLSNIKPLWIETERNISMKYSVLAIFFSILIQG
ncbi:MAG: hypothetical protein A3K23_03270 [Desulfobacca sp. RBG_16_58_9]|nr:MAG: hypothetical protein A3K23_03270 [Desulfobacca sp. RBG_16_58_9]